MLSDAIDFQFAKGADACAHTSPPSNDSNNDDDDDSNIVLIIVKIQMNCIEC